MGGRSGPTRWVHGAMTMKTAKVLVSDKLSEGGLDVLKRADCVDVDYKPGLSEDQLAEIIGDYDGLIIRSGSKVSEKVLNQAARLRVVGRAGIGVDNVDVPVASRRGVVVMNTPTGNAGTTHPPGHRLHACGQVGEEQVPGSRNRRQDARCCWHGQHRSHRCGPRPRPQDASGRV